MKMHSIPELLSELLPDIKQEVPKLRQVWKQWIGSFILAVPLLSFMSMLHLSPSLKAAATSSNSLLTDCTQQDLPVVTHWRHGVGTVAGASDQYILNNPSLPDQLINNTPLKYVYNYNILPTLDNYIGKNFSVLSISNDEATTFINKLCAETQQSYRLWKPKAFNGINGIQSILNSAPRKSGKVLIISGLTVSDSMFAVILPANWTPPSESNPTPYPILFNGFYDLNDNLFRLEGNDMATLVAQSTTPDESGRVGRGAIGVLWNGGGVIGSRTVNEKAYSEFQLVMDLVAKLGGNPHRLIGFGASRGGVTPLQMASNPYPHNYTFRMIYAAVPPGHIGSIAAVTSPTVPALLSSSDWSTGLADSYKRSFIYPNVGNGLAGLSGMEAHVRVLTGARSLQEADEHYSLGSTRMIQSLKNAGTHVYLEIGSHDDIVPTFDQIWLYRQYKEAGIPIELKINYLAGHFTNKSTRNRFLKRSMQSYTHRAIPAHPQVSNGAQHFYKVHPQTNLLVPLKNHRFLLTLEFPRYLSPEVNGIIIATGEPNTQVEISYFPGEMVDANPANYKLNMTINSWGYSIFQFDPREVPAVTYEITGIKMKGPDEDQWRSVPLTERTYLMSAPNEPFNVEILAEHPNGYSGDQVTPAIMQGYLGVNFEKRRGPLFQSVSYGIIEPD